MPNEDLVLTDTPVKKTRKPRVKKESMTEGDLKVKKPKKVKAEKPKTDIRTKFRELLAKVDIEQLKKPWMAYKSFRLIHETRELQSWVKQLLADKSKHYDVFGTRMPVLAIDTETIGLDTRIIVEWVKEFGPCGEMYVPVYEVNTEIAGICLSADGIEGLYIPINHEDGVNMDRAECTRILQPLLDASHHVYYNAKFDREILRQTMGMEFRLYPHFEDVQAINFINDPKADLGDKARGQFTGSSGGLKGLSKNVLDIEQIELEELGKVKADYINEDGKKSQRIQYVPFTWIPTDMALWYAAGDAICTWLLWEKLHPESRTHKTVHKVDHQLIDSLTWLERQRYLIDTERHARTVNWHQNKLKSLREELRQLAIANGYEEITEADGSVLDDNKFSPDSPIQTGKLVFDKMKLKVIKRSKKTGNPSFDSEVVEELIKLYPDNPFLKRFSYYKDYFALHPENLKYDKRDNSARVYLKACVVAGGRLSAAGGDFEVDGGFGLNIQGIKRIEGHLIWKVKGKVLEPDYIDPDTIDTYDESDLHPSCFKKGIKAPGIVNNHIGQYLGYAICLVPKCKSCADKYGILIEKATLDANEVINLRCLFTAADGWTFFTVDYSNIEMRAAANLSGEPEFIKEFLEGEGDFHSLTASKVFPEFNDPNTSKDVKKSLRALAKIINFALLYGGTEYTIFENMKKQDPTITFEKAKKMVADYWAGVPAYDAWCRNKQAIARANLICKTATGRVINFESGMKTLGIHKPTKEENENYWDHRRIVGKQREAEKEGDKDRAAKYREQADKMWKDTETGVRNAGDYNQFMGKIQRVSVNVPVQGLAGDFMRMTLNRLFMWAAVECPDIQSVLRLHGSVHDEVDFAVKNEYVPFIIPRITRMMKLRAMHEKLKWSVPIECDCEYGKSWDVEHHLTGDDSHPPAGWTEVPGMERYIPDEFDPATLKALIAALESKDEKRVAKVKAWAAESLHARVQPILKFLFAAEGKAAITKTLIAALQLHEYWGIDHVPDDQGASMETLEQFEARCGLTKADRGLVPPIGYIGAVPLDANVKRPKLMILNEPTDVENVDIIVSETKVEVSVSDITTTSVITKTVETEEGVVEVSHVVKEPKDPVKQPLPDAQEDMFLDIPVVHKKKVVEEVVAPTPVFRVANKSGLPVLLEMDGVRAKQLREALGVGNKTVKAIYQGKTLVIPGVGHDTVPDEFLRKEINV